MEFTETDCSSPITDDQLKIAKEVEKLLSKTSPGTKMVDSFEIDETESEKLGNKKTTHTGRKKKTRIIDLEEENKNLKEQIAELQNIQHSDQPSSTCDGELQFCIFTLFQIETILQRFTNSLLFMPVRLARDLKLSG
ncbi:uncharacterized protein LOC120355437 [Nilaparvata lugens]|uniref:uncharacterized protein LOC120355437 n=1 Tax=Nilaparvata lugens TaxID=108931 RepID=UPI00193D965E|nr:uncharacterized protein LOC120355437 [Nilaparvata lugens]